MSEVIAVSGARAGEAGDLEFVCALQLFIGPNAASYLQHFMRALAGIGMSLAGTATASDFRARLIGCSASDASIASPRSAAAIPACDAGQTRQLLGDLVGQCSERKGRNFSNLRLQDARGVQFDESANERYCVESFVAESRRYEIDFTIQPSPTTPGRFQVRLLTLAAKRSGVQ